MKSVLQLLVQLPNHNNQNANLMIAVIEGVIEVVEAVAGEDHMEVIEREEEVMAVNDMIAEELVIEMIAAGIMVEVLLMVLVHRVDLIVIVEIEATEATVKEEIAREVIATNLIGKDHVVAHANVIVQVEMLTRIPDVIVVMVVAIVAMEEEMAVEMEMEMVLKVEDMKGEEDQNHLRGSIVEEEDIRQTVHRHSADSVTQSAFELPKEGYWRHHMFDAARGRQVRYN